MRVADHYQTLEIRPDASQAEVNAAFRRLARERHPDRFVRAPESARAEAEERFKILSVAYEVLRDSERRAAYDRMRVGGAPVQAIEVRPGAVQARSAAGTFSVDSELHILEGSVAEMRLDVRCDDAGVELTSLDARPDRQFPHVLHLTLRGRVVDGGSRAMHFLYTAGAAAAAQAVDLRVIAPGWRGFARSVSFTRFGGFWGWYPYALITLGVTLACVGAASWFAGLRPFAFFAISFGVPVAIVGLVLIARNWVVMRFALEGWGRWIVIGLTFVGLRLAFLLARNAF